MALFLSSRRSVTLHSNLPLLLSLAASLSLVAPALVNVTVDDQLGDRTTGLIPEYLPNDGTWHVGSPTEDCPSCKIKPSTLDLSQIHEETWHDTTHTPPLTPATVTVHFNGSAVYVFNILPNTLLNDTTTFVNITFSIDGEDAGTFTRSPDSSSTILYNQLIYRNVTLQDAPHTLIMTAGGDSKSLFLFDYLLYTTQGNDSVTTSALQQTVSSSSTIPSTSTPTSLAQSPSSSSRTPVGAIAGGVVAGVAIILGIAVATVLLRRRSLRLRPSQAEWSARGGSEGANGGFSGVSSDSLFPHDSSAEPRMQSLANGSYPALADGALGARNRTRYHDDPDALDTDPWQDSDSSRPPLPPTGGSHSQSSRSPDMDQWSSKRRAELTRRLETLQRTRSILSSGSEPRTGTETEFSMGSGTQRAMGELEAEIAELRGLLTALSARLADSNAAGSPGEQRGLGPRESLPAYAE